MKIELFEKAKHTLHQEAAIHRREDYFNSAVLVLLIPIDGIYHLLFEKRTLSIRQGGEICFPGGKVDKEDKTLEETALRETFEELGIAKEHIDIIGRLDTIINPLGTIIDAFIGVTDVAPEDIQPNSQEVDYIIPIPLSYFLEHEPMQYAAKVKMHPSFIKEETKEEIVLLPSEALGLSKKYKAPWGDFEYGIFVYKVQGELIWGITARLVLDLVVQLKNTVDKSLKRDFIIKQDGV